MRYLLLLCAVLGSHALPNNQPVVYSYASNSPQETTGSEGYELEATTPSPSAEEETTEPYKEPDKSEPDSRGNKELLQPKFFAYSDQLGSGQGEQDATQELETSQERETSQEGEPSQEQAATQEQDDDEKFTRGGGQEHTVMHDQVHGKKGDKSFKQQRKYARGQKGVHDKESHKGKYVDSKGVKGKKKEEGGHFGLHHHVEKGRKTAKYGESGEHKKGHHTKGEHNIHKKDEYVKRHEFYDEHHEGGEHEKKGGFRQHLSKKRGKKKKRGHRKSAEAAKKYGRSKKKKKAGRILGTQGHSRERGHTGRFTSLGKYGRRRKFKTRRKNMYPSSPSSEEER